MSKSEIIYQVTIDTEPLNRQLRVLKWRMHLALFLIKIAGKLGRQKITVGLETEQVKR